MWVLVGRLILWALARRTAVALGTGALIGEAAVSLQDLRNRAQVEAGASDIQALDEAARTAARMLGLDGTQILWPMDRLGNHIAPKYFHVDLVRGRAWYTAQYFSRKSVMRGRSGGTRWRAWQRGYQYNRIASIAAHTRPSR